MTSDQAVEIYRYKLLSLNGYLKDGMLLHHRAKGCSGPLALKYGVSPKAIRDIWNRRTWAFATVELWKEEEPGLLEIEITSPSSVSVSQTWTLPPLFGHGLPYNQIYLISRPRRPSDQLDCRSTACRFVNAAGGPRARATRAPAPAAATRTPCSTVANPRQQRRRSTPPSSLGAPAATLRSPRRRLPSPSRHSAPPRRLPRSRPRGPQPNRRCTCSRTAAARRSRTPAARAPRRPPPALARGPRRRWTTWRTRSTQTPSTGEPPAGPGSAGPDPQQRAAMRGWAFVE